MRSVHAYYFFSFIVEWANAYFLAAVLFRRNFFNGNSPLFIGSDIFFFLKDMVMKLIMPFWKDDDYSHIMFINVVDRADVSTSLIHSIGLYTRQLFVEFGVLDCCPPTALYEGVFGQQPRIPFSKQKCRRITVSGFDPVAKHYTPFAEKFVENPDASCFVLKGTFAN
jgi:hypothetical protein